MEAKKRNATDIKRKTDIKYVKLVESRARAKGVRLLRVKQCYHWQETVKKMRKEWEVMKKIAGPCKISRLKGGSLRKGCEATKSHVALAFARELEEEVRKERVGKIRTCQKGEAQGKRPRTHPKEEEK